MSYRKKPSGCLATILFTLAFLVGGTVLMVIGGLVSNHRAEKRWAEYAAQQQEQQRIQAEEEAAILAAQEAYNNSFAPLREDGYVCSETADKAVAMYFDLDDPDGTFVDRFVPEALKATTPEDTRYLVKVVYRKEAEGTYVGMVTATAYRRYYDVQVYDLLDGLLLTETTFTGSAPPSTLRENDKNGGIGEYPNDAEVSEWIPTGIEEGLLAKAAAQKDQAYHESMTVLSGSTYRCDPTADKIIIRESVHKDDKWTVFYSKEFVPENLVADSAEEVRYVVELLKTFDAVGTYFGVGGSHTAYQHRYKLTIIDLTTGKVIAENQIYGGDAPQTYTKENNGVGTPPDPQDVTDWIINSISPT